MKTDTRLLRLQTVGGVELPDDDLTLLQGGWAWRVGGAAVNPQRPQGGDEAPLQLGVPVLPGRFQTLAAVSHSFIN